MSKFLSADEILGADDQVFFEVDTPEWGGKVRCRTLTASERDQWEKSMDKDADKSAARNRGNARAILVSKVIVDEHGVRVFTKPDQIIKLGSKNSAPINRIFQRVLDESKVSKEDLEELEQGFPEESSDDFASS